LPLAPSPFRAGRRGYTRSPLQNATTASIVAMTASIVAMTASIVAAEATVIAAVATVIALAVHMSMGCAGRQPNFGGRSLTTAARLPT
jgi:hypothetical protein